MMSRAAWVGSMIVLLCGCPESTTQPTVTATATATATAPASATATATASATATATASATASATATATSSAKPTPTSSVAQTPALAAKIKKQFGDHCRFERACGALWGIDCDAAVDGPYYYVKAETMEKVASCGGNCMGGRCTNCPPKEWTCATY